MAKSRVRINKLQMMAINNFSLMTKDEELRKLDLTETYTAEKEKMVEAGELINIQLNGIPGSGKSTVMIAEVVRINELLQKKTDIDHILPNQIVYAQVMKQIIRRMDVCIGIDEYDELGETGYNATVEQSAINHYSDLHRAHYIHKIACAPKNTMDKNAFLFLEILGADKERKFTRCLLYYKLFIRGQEHLQLLGHVDIDVSNILETELYAEYDRRKMHRLRLFSECGIIHERHIFAAKLVLEAYKGLKPMARHSNITKETCKLKVDMVARKQKVMNSILTTMATAGDLLALLGYVKEQEKTKKKIQKAKQALGKVPGMENSLHIMIEELAEYLQDLCNEEALALQYWKEASDLEHLYISNLGKDIDENTQRDSTEV